MQVWQQGERARAALAREVGYVRKPHAGRLRVVLAFPNTYHVGMSNLGFQTVYHQLNALDDVVCERVFLPPRQEVAALLASKTPLITLESQSPVAEADVLAFSVSFEWDYTNVVTMLRLAGLPIYADQRSDRHPLVLLGGAITFLNPEPLAPFFDVVAAGESEALIPVLTETVSRGGERGVVQRALAQHPGFYVPAFYDVTYGGAGAVERVEPRLGTGAPAQVRKAAVTATASLDPPCTHVFTPDTEFGSRFLVEVVRGCANLCRFCWAGYNYLPTRAFPAERILALADRARAHAQRAGLVSIALCDHPDIDMILARLLELGYTISPASLRLDDLSAEIVRRLRQSGERTLTIAPETGSDRLRRVINKTFTNSQILDRAEMIFASGIENLKLYFMIGLPTEQDEDLVAIRDLTIRLREIMIKHGRRRGRLGRIIGSVNPLIPKPGTAFQWLPMTRPREIAARIRRLRRLMAGLDNVFVSIKSERQSYYQALLSTGDRRVAGVIDAAATNGGNWREAVASTGLDADAWVFRDRSGDQVLPWDIIDGGLKSAFFRSEYDRSLRGEVTWPRRRQAVASPPSGGPQLESLIEPAPRTP